jgi:hypothetical protein
MRRPGLLVALILAVGVAGAVAALKSRESNAQFVAQQQELLPVDAAALQRLILTTSDPRPGYGGGRARSVRCASTAGGALRNPWTCVVRYPRLPRVRYGVVVDADRSIQGYGQPEGHPLAGSLSLSGCCVGGP